ncbi:MAG: YceI family protein [Thermoanaerobaculia bacterium]
MNGKLVPAALLASALLGSSANGETWTIDGLQSSFTVHVFKSGLFSAFGDNHVVKATVASGSVSDGDKPAVEVAVDARQMTVLDPELAPAKRADVQKRMLGPEVLDVVKFPEIRFRSTAVEATGEGRWRVEGLLELHGKKVPLSFEVTGSKERFHGSATVSQRAFGIEPISVAGGTVKVRDDVKVDFEIATSSPAKPVSGGESAPTPER